MSLDVSQPFFAEYFQMEQVTSRWHFLYAAEGPWWIVEEVEVYMVIHGFSKFAGRYFHLLNAAQSKLMLQAFTLPVL